MKQRVFSDTYRIVCRHYITGTMLVFKFLKQRNTMALLVFKSHLVGEKLYSYSSFRKSPTTNHLVLNRLGNTALLTELILMYDTQSNDV